MSRLPGREARRPKQPKDTGDCPRRAAKPRRPPSMLRARRLGIVSSSQLTHDPSSVLLKFKFYSVEAGHKRYGQTAPRESIDAWKISMVADLQIKFSLEATIRLEGGEQ